MNDTFCGKSLHLSCWAWVKLHFGLRDRIRLVWVFLFFNGLLAYAFENVLTNLFKQDLLQHGSLHCECGFEGDIA